MYLNYTVMFYQLDWTSLNNWDTKSLEMSLCIVWSHFLKVVWVTSAQYHKSQLQHTFKCSHKLHIYQSCLFNTLFTLRYWKKKEKLMNTYIRINEYIRSYFSSSWLFYCSLYSYTVLKAHSCLKFTYIILKSQTCCL